jgi:hypothetical protein
VVLVLVLRRQRVLLEVLRMRRRRLVVLRVLAMLLVGRVLKVLLELHRDVCGLRLELLKRRRVCLAVLVDGLRRRSGGGTPRLALPLDARSHCGRRLSMGNEVCFVL